MGETLSQTLVVILDILVDKLYFSKIPFDIDDLH